MFTSENFILLIMRSLNDRFPFSFSIPFYIQGTPFNFSDISSFCVEENVLLITSQENDIHEFTFSSDLEKAQIIQMLTIYIQHL